MDANNNGIDSSAMDIVLFLSMVSPSVHSIITIHLFIVTRSHIPAAMPRNGYYSYNRSRTG
jgi:hypothetical protein